MPKGIIIQKRGTLVIKDPKLGEEGELLVPDKELSTPYNWRQRLGPGDKVAFLTSKDTGAAEQITRINGERA